MLYLIMLLIIWYLTYKVLSNKGVRDKFGSLTQGWLTRTEVQTSTHIKLPSSLGNGGPVRLKDIQKGDQIYTDILNTPKGTRRIYAMDIPGTDPLYSESSEDLRLFASIGPGRKRSIYAMILQHDGTMIQSQVLTVIDRLVNNGQIALHKSVIRAIEDKEKCRFQDWMAEASKRPADPNALRHVLAWARRIKRDRSSAPVVEPKTHARTFFKAVGSCGVIEPMLELQRYLKHETDTDISIEDEIYTLEDVARAIEFFMEDIPKNEM
jgi:hypothetical protein